MITTNNTSNKKIIMPDWKTQYLNRLTIYNIYIQKYNKALQQDQYGDDGIISNISRDTGIENKNNN